MKIVLNGIEHYVYSRATLAAKDIDPDQKSWHGDLLNTGYDENGPYLYRAHTWDQVAQALGYDVSKIDWAVPQDWLNRQPRNEYGYCWIYDEKAAIFGRGLDKDALFRQWLRALYGAYINGMESVDDNDL